MAEISVIDYLSIDLDPQETTLECLFKIPFSEYTFNIIGQEIYDSISCYLLESVPRDHIRTEYSQHNTWVDTSLFLPLKEKSYDKSGELLKEKYFFYSHINDYDVLSEIKVRNVQKDHYTNLTFKNIELDTGVEDKLFHEMYLKRLPQ